MHLLRDDCTFFLVLSDLMFEAELISALNSPTVLEILEPDFIRTVMSSVPRPDMLDNFSNRSLQCYNFVSGCIIMTFVLSGIYMFISGF